MPAASSLLLAAAISIGISLLAWRARSLSRSGAVAAVAIGTAALATDAAWGGYLVTWFVVTASLSRLGRIRKAQHVAGVVDKGGTRDATQVLANGGVFALGAVATWFVPGAIDGAAPMMTMLAVSAAAALASAGADTWATEVGTWVKPRAWSLRTGRTVQAGTSGAITWPGTLALGLGALCWGLIAAAFGVVPREAVWAVMLGGVAGAMADSLIGAWLQERRWCDACTQSTEQRVHDCGVPSRRVSGLSWLDNDAVNLTATCVGAVTAALVGMG